MENGRRKWLACWAAAGLFLAASVGARATETDAYPTVRESMIVMSRQLGVTCLHCHDVGNLKSTAKPAFQIAKRHIQVVQTLNGAQGFGGKPKVDCFMCHRGQATYPYAEAQAVRGAKR